MNENNGYLSFIHWLWKAALLSLTLLCFNIQRKQKEKTCYVDLRFGRDIHILSWAKVSSIKRSAFMKENKKSVWNQPKNNFIKHKLHTGSLLAIRFQNVRRVSSAILIIRNVNNKIIKLLNKCILMDCM